MCCLRELRASADARVPFAQGEGTQCCGGSARFPYGVSAPDPHASGLRRLSVRIMDGTEKLTLYRDVAGAEPVSSMAAGSEEEARKTLYCLFSG